MSRLFASLVAAALALAGCTSSDDTGRLTIRLTDAAGSVDAAVVTIDRITLHGTAGELVLSDTRTTVDLLSLANATTDLVKDVVVPVGTYSQLRFRISGGYVQSGGEIFASSPEYEGLPEGAQVTGRLKMPSFAQSGLKVTLPGDALVVAAGSKILLVDFDVAQSFGHEAGGSGSWVMHPVIKGAELELSGNVVASLALARGVTLPVRVPPLTLADFKAVLTKVPTAPDELPSAETLAFADDGTGKFTATFLYLLPGDYTVDVTGPAGVTFATEPGRPAAVTVTGGADALAPFTITSASAPPPPPAP